MEGEEVRRLLMSDLLTRRRTRIGIVAIALLAGGAGHVHAQGFISPFFGYNFGGDSSCREVTNCRDKHGDYGVAFGALGSFVGFEAEYAHTNDFLGESPSQSTTVRTFMANLMLAPKLGPIQPYGAAGVGLIRTEIEGLGERNEDNQVGWDAGGGLIIFFNPHVGIRGDVRYFHSFEVFDLGALLHLPIRSTRLDFGRFSGAMVFKW
jgi:opacity protein-like surface antigen